MTGPLDREFAQVRGCLDESERVLNAAWEVKPAIRALPADLEAAISALDVEDALAALSSIERHVQEDVEEWEQIAAEKGLPFLLDHLGLDGLANEVVAQKRHVQDLEKALLEIETIANKGPTWWDDPSAGVGSIARAALSEVSG